jgi:hypothetical protein
MCGQEPETVQSWGFRDLHDPGLSVSLHRRPDRLVIEIQAPMSLLNLDVFADDAQEAVTPESGGQAGPGCC